MSLPYLKHARVQAVQPAKRGPRALVPRTPSLDQAGGVQRITLRGHTGPITRVLLAEGGIDVVTGALLLLLLSAG